MDEEQRLIDAEALKRRIGDLHFLNYGMAIMAVCEAPTVDAVPVVHAHWEDGYGMDHDGNVTYKSIDCSHCNEVFKIESHDREYWKKRFKACPFCWAYMRGEEDG